MSRIIHIAGNAGAGKSIVALNLSIALRQLGVDIILIDGNIYSPDIANYSDISPNVFLNEFLNNERAIEEIITHHPSGVKIIAAMPEEEYNEEYHKKLNQALISLLGKSDIILVDSFSHAPALFSVLHSADDTIFVTNDDFHSIAKSKELIKKMEEKGINIVGVVINRKRKSSNIKNIESIIGKKILAELPYDEDIINSTNIKQPFLVSNPKSGISRSINELARLINIK